MGNIWETKRVNNQHHEKKDTENIYSSKEMRDKEMTIEEERREEEGVENVIKVR